MARCDRGYLCVVCGEEVEELVDSDLYLRYALGEVDPELLHNLPERHIRCNPTLAQFIVADGFPPVEVDGASGHVRVERGQLDQRAQVDRLISRGVTDPSDLERVVKDRAGRALRVSPTRAGERVRAARDLPDRS